MTRPGVPTTICGPWRNCTVCSGIGWPPKQATTRTPLNSENVRNACATWIAELARRHEHEHLDVLGCLVDLVDGGQAEGGGLPAARLGLADDVAAAHDHRDRLDLNGQRLAVLERLDGIEHALERPSSANPVNVISSVVSYRHGETGRKGRERRGSSRGLRRGARRTFPVPQG